MKTIIKEPNWLLGILQRNDIGNHMYTLPHETYVVSGHQLQNIIKEIEENLGLR